MMLSKEWTSFTPLRKFPREPAISPNSELDSNIFIVIQSTMSLTCDPDHRDVIIVDSGELEMEQEVDAEGNQVPFRQEL